MTEFEQAMFDAMNEYRRMRKDGVSREDAVKGLALVVKESWPRGREEPWRYYCESCSDSGLRTVLRASTLYGHDVPYAEPCICRKGQAWLESHRPNTEPPPPPTREYGDVERF